MSSKNAHGDMCMDWKTNHRDALALIADFRRSHGLQARPLYALGVSVGGGFVAKLAAFVKMDGVVSEVLGPKPAEWDLSRYQHGGRAAGQRLRESGGEQEAHSPALRRPHHGVPA